MRWRAPLATHNAGICAPRATPLKVERRAQGAHVRARHGRVSQAAQRAAHTPSACGTAVTRALGVVALAPRHSATCGQHGVVQKLRSLACG